MIKKKDEIDVSMYVDIQGESKNILQKSKDKKEQEMKKEQKKLKYRIALNITEDEGRALEKKAGIASVNDFLRHYLRNETDIFKK